MRMATIHITTIAIAFCAYTALAQQSAMGSLTVTVEDQTGAYVAGASIAITNEASGARYEAKADANGLAVFHLAQGHYNLKVQAKGFETREEKDVEMNTETKRTVTLPLSQRGCVWVVEGEDLEYLFEHQVLTAEIPLLPMQLLELTAKPLRHRWHWF